MFKRQNSESHYNTYPANAVRNLFNNHREWPSPTIFITSENIPHHLLFITSISQDDQSPADLVYRREYNPQREPWSETITVCYRTFSLSQLQVQASRQKNVVNCPDILL